MGNEERRELLLKAFFGHLFRLLDGEDCARHDLAFQDSKWTLVQLDKTCYSEIGHKMTAFFKKIPEKLYRFYT